MNVEPTAQMVARAARKVAPAADNLRPATDDFRATADDLFADPPWGNEMPWWKSPLETQQAEPPSSIVVRWTDPAGKVGPRMALSDRTYSTHSQLEVLADESQVLLRTANGPRKYVREASPKPAHHYVGLDKFGADKADAQVGTAVEELFDVVRRSGLQESQTVAVGPGTPVFGGQFRGYVDAGDAVASLWYRTPAGASTGTPQHYHLAAMTDQQPLLDVVHAARRLAGVVRETAEAGAKEL